MKRTAGAVLVLMMASPGALAQDSAPSFEATNLSCDEVKYSSAIRNEIPNVKKACTAVVKRGDRVYLEFKTRVDRVWNRGKNLKVRLASGETYATELDENLKILMNGEEIPPRDLKAGDELSFYLRNDATKLSLIRPEDDPQPAAGAEDDDGDEAAMASADGADDGETAGRGSGGGAKPAASDGTGGAAAGAAGAGALAQNESDEDEAMADMPEPASKAPPRLPPKPAPPWDPPIASFVAMFLFLGLIGAGVFWFLTRNIGRRGD